VVVPICARILDAALMPIGHPLNVHHFLMVGSVVMHHRQQRDAVVRRRPKDPVGIHQVPVRLRVNVEPAVLPVGQCGTHRGRGRKADAA
jgi:hypothetical protein